MTGDSLISIVMPCYNAEKYLGEALESCLQQTHSNFEVICIDDGSTDSSAQILKNYSTKHAQIKVFTTKNQGVSHARNLGTQNARAEWIQYLDADDLLLPEALQKKANVVLENQDVDVVYSAWQKLNLIRGHFVKGEEMFRQIDAVNPAIAIFKGFWAPTASYLYRKSMVAEIGGWNVTLPVIQDARFVLDFALHGAKFVYVEEVLCLFRSGHENTLSSRKSAFVKDCFNNAEDIRQIWERQGVSAPQRDALIEVYLYIARSAYAVDGEIFKQATQRLKALDQNFIRLAPPLLRLTAQLAGYERAEAIAQKWQHIKKCFRKDSGRVL